MGDEPIVLLFFFLNVLSGSENECHPSRERVSGCLKQAGTEAKKWMGGERGVVNHLMGISKGEKWPNSDPPPFPSAFIICHRTKTFLNPPHIHIELVLCNMVSLKTGSPQRWRNGWFENLNIERTFCSNSGGPWVRPLSAPGRGFYPHFHLYEAPTALVPPFATMSRTRGLQKANVVSRSWVCCFSRHNLWFQDQILFLPRTIS